MEACYLFERYTALTSDDSRRRTNVRGVKPAYAPKSTHPAVSQQQLSEAIVQFTEQMGRQFQQLAELIKAPSTESRPPQPRQLTQGQLPRLPSHHQPLHPPTLHRATSSSRSSSM